MTKTDVVVTILRFKYITDIFYIPYRNPLGIFINILVRAPMFGNFNGGMTS